MISMAVPSHFHAVSHVLESLQSLPYLILGAKASREKNEITQKANNTKKQTNEVGIDIT